MVSLFQPLSSEVNIVDEQGRPTPQFILLLQKLGVGSGLTASNGSIQIATMVAHTILANKTGATASPTACTVSDILDFVTTTRGSVLFRGASGWQALAPGTSGKVLQTNGAGADPTWVTPSAGGGAFVNLASQTLAVAAATITFTGLDQTHTDLIAVLTGQGDTASSFADLIMKINNDSGTNYDYQTMVANAAALSSAGLAGQTSVLAGWVPAATGVANAASTTEITFPNYANTTFHKDFRTTGGLRISAVSSGIFKKDIWGDWRSTAAINRLDFSLSAGNFVIGTKVTIYGRG